MHLFKKLICTLCMAVTVFMPTVTVIIIDDYNR